MQRSVGRLVSVCRWDDPQTPSIGVRSRTQDKEFPVAVMTQVLEVAHEGEIKPIFVAQLTRGTLKRSLLEYSQSHILFFALTRKS